MKNANQKLTLKGKVKIIENDNDKYVIKEKNKDLKSLFNYLESRSFNNYPSIIDEDEHKIIYEYINDLDIPLNQKAVDMGKVLSNLHYKTSYYKEVVKDNIKELYENILSNIIYLEDYYNKLFTLGFNEEYPRPSYYLLLRNQTKINGLIKYLKDELEKWYKESIDLDKIRVVYNHNNLSINHFLESDKKYFISWDNYLIDSPVIDLINIYHHDFNKYDYSSFLNTYLTGFELTKEEKRLLFIMLSIPDINYLTDNEMDNTINISKLIDYINETEKIIKPYYPLD